MITTTWLAGPAICQGRSAPRLSTHTPRQVDPPRTRCRRAFEEDLAGWLGQLDAVCVDRRIARVYVIGWLALMATTLAIPLIGIGAVLAAVGVLVMTMVKVWEASCGRTDQVESIQRTGATRLRAQGRAAVGPVEPAQLVRLMNLFRARSRPVARPLLRAELQEARSREPLAHWKPLRDLEEVLRTDGSRPQAHR